MNKWNNWVSKELDVDLSVNGNGDIEVVITENESGDFGKLVFDKKDTEEDIIGRVGTEIYSWISMMCDEANEQ